MRDRKRVREILRLLRREYPAPRTALRFRNPFELLIATILSARCTDRQVNRVTRNLFKKYRTPEDYVRADIRELEEDLRSLGLYRSKARHIKKACTVLVEKHSSRVPRRMEELVALPGVARKTANVVLSNAFNVSEGIAVDTHVSRLARRLGLTRSSHAEKIEEDLMAITPRGEWSDLSHLLIFHGRRVCKARNPLCGICVLKRLCPSAKA
jgi:endonuclease-3